MKGIRTGTAMYPDAGAQFSMIFREEHPHGNCDVSGCRCSVLHDLPRRVSTQELLIDIRDKKRYIFL